MQTPHLLKESQKGLNMEHAKDMKQVRITNANYQKASKKSKKTGKKIQLVINEALGKVL